MPKLKIYRDSSNCGTTMNSTTASTEKSTKPKNYTCMF